MNGIMWRVGALAVASAFAGVAFADGPCKKIKVKQDKFGGGGSFTASALTGMVRPVDLILSFNAGTASLKYATYEDGAITGTVAAGTQLLLRFSDDSVAEWKTTDPAALTPDVEGDGVMTQVPFIFTLTPEQVKKLASSDLVAIRAPRPSGGGMRDWEPKPKHQQNLRAAANCAIELGSTGAK